MSFGRLILAIETSCDDTSVAMVREDGFVEVLMSANQDLVHRPYGGIVPEIASRSHTETLMPLIDQVLQKVEVDPSQLAAIAVTSEPGLVGSLMIGVVTAKSLGLVWSVPVVGVNHIEGHLLAPLLRDSTFAPPDDFQFPYLGLAVSGGHTSLFVVEQPGRYRELGNTIDDAAGEAFDKFAKMMGLGYPGGVQVDRLASTGNIDAFKFPMPLKEEGNLNFSFSGLKAAAQRLVAPFSEEERALHLKNLCASYQETIINSLLEKLNRAQKLTKLDRVVITGGVSANSRLRSRAAEWAKDRNVQLVIPPLKYCTDNAAMIGYAGWFRLKNGLISDSYLAPSATSTERSGFICLK